MNENSEKEVRISFNKEKNKITNFSIEEYFPNDSINIYSDVNADGKLDMMESGHYTEDNKGGLHLEGIYHIPGPDLQRKYQNIVTRTRYYVSGI